MTLSAGDTLGGRYTLRRASWTTPLGPVWDARDSVLARTVSVQVLTDELARDPAVRARLQRGAARIAQVTHTGITRIFDIGSDPAFIVFEHGAGGRLSDRLARGAMRTNDAARVALSLARGLEALHAAGMTHGSLAPSSVLLDEEGRARILALGITGTLAGVHGVDPQVEQPDGYRPPERIHDEAGAQAADRYALAALTHHAMTGRPPGVTTARRLALPNSVVSLLSRSLSPDPAARPSLDAFIGGLAPFARLEPPKARHPRTIAAEFRWLVPAIAIVIAATVALTFGARLITDLAREDPSPSASPSTTVAAGDPIPIREVRDFDPHGSDGEENPDRVERAIDGDPSTAWTTLNYVNRGFDKPGVGLLFDLGAPTPIAAVTIATDLPGWSAEIRVADEDGDDETSFTVVESFEAQNDNVIALPAGTSARFVLLWFTEGADRGSDELPYRAEAAEVSFTA